MSYSAIYTEIVNDRPIFAGTTIWNGTGYAAHAVIISAAYTDTSGVQRITYMDSWIDQYVTDKYSDFISRRTSSPQLQTEIRNLE